MEWNPEWGNPDHYNIVPDRTELAGFKIGDRVEAARDDEDNGIYRDDEGVVIGISHTKAGLFYNHDRDRVCVAWDGMDPSCCDPDVLEHL